MPAATNLMVILSCSKHWFLQCYSKRLRTFFLFSCYASSYVHNFRPVISGGYGGLFWRCLPMVQGALNREIFAWRLQMSYISYRNPHSMNSNKAHMHSQTNSIFITQIPLNGPIGNFYKFHILTLPGISVFNFRSFVLELPIFSIKQSSLQMSY